jgi:hypothetical protein
VDIRNQGSFYPATHEDVFDSLTMIAQQIDDEAQRSVVLDESFDPIGIQLAIIPGTSGQVLGWGPGGLVNLDVTGGGVQGPQGIQGVPGEGVPVGGTTGQVLAKTSGTNFDTEWVDQEIGGGGGGITEAYANTKYVRLIGGDPGGHMTGPLGIGITPLYPLHVETSVPADKVAFIRNTAANGFGLKLQNGLNTNYAFKIVNAADTASIIQGFGAGVLMIGPNAGAQSRALAGGQPALVIANGIGIAGGDAQIHFVSNSAVDNTYGGGATGGPNRQSIGVAGASLGKERHAMFYLGSDFGFRHAWNWDPDQSHPDTALGCMLWGDESNGAITFDYIQPAVSTPTTWSVLSGGKQLSIFPGGWNIGDGYQVGEFVDICSFRATRGISVRVSPTTNAGLEVLRLAGDVGNANRVSVYVDSALKNVTQGADDAAGTGFTYLRVPN